MCRATDTSLRETPPQQAGSVVDTGTVVGWSSLRQVPHAAMGGCCSTAAPRDDLYLEEPPPRYSYDEARAAVMVGSDDALTQSMLERCRCVRSASLLGRCRRRCGVGATERPLNLPCAPSHRMIMVHVPLTVRCWRGLLGMAAAPSLYREPTRATAWRTRHQPRSPDGARTRRCSTRSCRLELPPTVCSIAWGVTCWLCTAPQSRKTRHLLRAPRPRTP